MKKGVEGWKSSMPQIVEEYYDYCAWLLPKVSKFQKDQRYILGARLQNRALDGLDLILAAVYSSGAEKESALRRAILAMHHINYYMRLAVQIKMINPRSYGYGSHKITQVSYKLGAWRKSMAL